MIWMEHVSYFLLISILSYLNNKSFRFLGPVMLDEFVEWLKNQQGDDCCSMETRGS